MNYEFFISELLIPNSELRTLNSELRTPIIFFLAQDRIPLGERDDTVKFA